MPVDEKKDILEEPRIASFTEEELVVKTIFTGGLKADSDVAA